MILQDMRKLYPAVYEKVSKDMDEAYKVINQTSYLSRAIFTETDDLRRLIKFCDEAKASYEKALDTIEREIPILDDDDLPSCPSCGAKVRIIDPDHPIVFTTFHISCPECGYSYKGEYFDVRDKTATKLARQNIIHTYTAKVKREIERRNRE